MATRAEANFEWDHSDRACLVCGDMYTPVRYTQKFCPPPKKCRNSQAARRMSAEVVKYPRICKDCGASFMPRATDQVRCGMDCPGKPPVLKTCAYAFCGQEFNVAYNYSPARQKYCSELCSNREWVFQKYSISSHDFLRMKTEQEGLCLACGDEPTPENDLVIDHDHTCCPPNVSCGKCIRGLLHRVCNMTEGLFKDNPERLSKLQDFMTSQK